MTTIHRHKNLSGKWTTQVDGDHSHPDLEARIAALEGTTPPVDPPPVDPPPVVVPPAAVAVISASSVVPRSGGFVATWDVAPASDGQVEYWIVPGGAHLFSTKQVAPLPHHVQDVNALAGDYSYVIHSGGATKAGTFTIPTVVVPPVIVVPPVVTPPPGTAPADTVLFPVAPSTQSDMRGQIQAFIEQQRNAGKTAGFEGVYRWDSRMVLSGSGIRIWLGPTAQFRRTVAGGVRSMLSPYKADGFTLTGSNALHFVGPASTAQVSAKNDDYPNEDEYAFEIYGGTGLTISNIKLFGFWSDGFYVYRADDNATGTHTRNLTLRDIDSSSMGRNSITVNSCEGLLIERFTGTVARLHGFDYEPNRVDDLLKDATIKDCGFFGFDAGLTQSGRGYAIAIGYKFGGGKATNVKVINQRQDTAVKGGTLYLKGPDNGFHDGVIVTGWSGASGSGELARIHNWQQSGNSISLPASGTVG